MNTIIEVKDLTVSVRNAKQNQTILDRISFSVKKGTTVGFIGPNGAGKTTTLHILLGFIEPTEGQATVLGANTQKPEARARIGYLSEHPECYKFMTGREYLRFIARLFGIPKKEREQRIETLLKEVNLFDDANKRISLYSRGMLQRIGLAEALINDPELLILDEPTNGLDPFGRLQIRKLIERLKSEGKTIFFSSHELSEIETVCDEIILINQGQILRQGAVAELVETSQSLEQYFIETLSQNK